MERFDHGGDIYGTRGVLLDFSVNINPFGMPEAVGDALISRINEFARYPDPLCRELCNAIAVREDLPVEWIKCGNGAADLIYRLCYAVKPGRAIVCAPTFSEYERALEQVSCQIIHHTLKEENGFVITNELVECIKSDIDMLFLCHPNNPTGRLISNDLMERIINKARQTNTLVVVDECFLEFTKGESAKNYLINTPRLCILKALTKIYAMAGLRVGYILTSDQTLMQKIDAAAQCWSVSVPAQIAGVTALTVEGWLKKTLSLVEEERRYLTRHLKNLGITVFPSDANYILIRTEHPLYEILLQKGIMIRHCNNFKSLDSSFFRVGIKTRRENNCLIKAIEEFNIHNPT